MAYNDIERARAEFARTTVNRFALEYKDSPQVLRKFRTHLRRLPAMLHPGIIQAAATLAADPKDAAAIAITDALKKWFEAQDCPVVFRCTTNAQLIDALLEIKDQPALWAIEREAAHCAGWLKVWTEALEVGK